MFILNYSILFILILFIKNKAKLVYQYLLTNLIISTIYHIFQCYCHFNKPYIGFHLLIFLTASSLLLLIPTLLIYFTLVFLKYKKTYKKIIINFWILISVLTAVIYPSICGDKLLIFFYSYYLLLAIFNLSVLIIESYHKALNLTGKSFLLLSLATIFQIIIYFSINDNWTLIQFSNFIFYLTILLFSLKR